MLPGSRSQFPAFPLGARVETMASFISSLRPEVSISPPSPPPGPPRALRAPSARVTESGSVTSLQSTMVPPSPTSVAEASMVAPFTMETSRASDMEKEGSRTRFCSICPPCQSPPARTTPPPSFPETSTRDSSPSRTRFPSRVATPPFPPLEDASKRPKFATWPLSPAVSMILPPSRRMPRAMILPLLLTIPPRSELLALAERTTRP